MFFLTVFCNSESIVFGHLRLQDHGQSSSSSDCTTSTAALGLAFDKFPVQDLIF